MNDGKMFYPNFYDALQEIADAEEYRGTVNAVMGYAFYGVEPDLDNLGSMGRIIFRMSKPVIDSNNKRKEDGTKGGRRPSGLKADHSNDMERKTNGSDKEAHRISGGVDYAAAGTMNRITSPERKANTGKASGRKESAIAEDAMKGLQQELQKGQNPQVHSDDSGTGDSNVDLKRTDEADSWLDEDTSV